MTLLSILSLYVPLLILCIFPSIFFGVLSLLQPELESPLSSSILISLSPETLSGSTADVQ